MTEITGDHDSHFAHFAGVLERAIARYGRNGLNKRELKVMQAQQIRELLDLETDFRVALCKSQWGDEVYLKFYNFVVKEMRSISKAQPFFRERAKVFTSDISPIFKSGTHLDLMRQPFRLNRAFVEFALAAVPWEPQEEVIEIASRIHAVRRELVEMNMPLAVSRARMFWGKTSRKPGARLTFLDFIQGAAIGLCIAVDKFMPSVDSRDPQVFGASCAVFMSTAITRISAHNIQAYSETSIHLSSTDRRRLYRFNKIKSMHVDGEVDPDVVMAEINRGCDPSKAATPDEIAELAAAASPLSIEPETPDDGDRVAYIGAVERKMASPVEDRPDAVVDRSRGYSRMSEAIKQLCLRDRKILQLSGVRLATA